MINSISGTLNPFSASAILRLRHLPRFSETELEHSFWCLFFGSRFGMHCGPDYTLSPMCPKKGSWGFLTERTSNLWKLRHESGDLNSSSHYHVKLIWCLLTLVGSTLILLHTGMEWPSKGNQNKKNVAYYVCGENGNISRMFLSKTDWRYHGEKVVFDHSCYEASQTLSVLCGDSSLIFIFYSVAISTEILTHYSCFMEKNEKWGSGLNFINSIKDLPQQNIWKWKFSFSEVHILTSDKARLYDVYVVKKISRTNSRQDAALNIGPSGAQNFHRVSLCPP